SLDLLSALLWPLAAIFNRVAAQACSAAADGFEHVLGMPLDPDLAPDPPDLSVRADQESRAVDAHVFASIHLLFHPDAIGLGRLKVLVGSERDAEAVLAAEIVVLASAVRRNSNDCGAGSLELALQPGKIDRFERTAFRIVLRIEVEDHGFARMFG